LKTPCSRLTFGIGLAMKRKKPQTKPPMPAMP
jgi:hypothetical protein